MHVSSSSYDIHETLVSALQRTAFADCSTCVCVCVCVCVCLCASLCVHTSFLLAALGNKSTDTHVADINIIILNTIIYIYI